MSFISLILLLLTTSVGADGNPTNNLRNWGLINNLAKSHIDAPKAWSIEESGENVVVAVIDTGVDVTHPDLQDSIWHDPKHPKTYGWDFVTNSPNPLDGHGHGTHVSGIIAAMNDFQHGVSGVSHHVLIMPVRFYSDGNTGAVNLHNTVKAINYAVSHGAKIINYSGGGPEFCEDEYIALKKAESNGVLVVSAAGNEHQNSDMVENYYYPSAYRLSNIVSVEGTDIRNNLIVSSNWGRSKVDVAAPGENIYSTLPDGKFGYMTGTSQATAFVTGVAALLLSEEPSLSPQQIREILISSVDEVEQLRGKSVSGGRINAYSALSLLKKKCLDGTIRTCKNRWGK
jgi:subtilisin family serine protease